MKKGNPGIFLVCFIVFVAGLSVFWINTSTATSKPNVVRLIGGSRDIISDPDAGSRIWELNSASPEIDNRLENPIMRKPPDQITCNRSHPSYDICTVDGPTVFDPRESTFFLVDPAAPSHPVKHHKIRPYPRKWEKSIMSKIREFTLTTGTPAASRCNVKHNMPALVFSTGGYTGNFFHEFNDGIIPLFITANTVYPNREFVILVENKTDGWVSKYTELLHAFSQYPIVDIDGTNGTHCFPSATLGLISHGFMTIKPNLIPNSISLRHFRSFIDKAYKLKASPERKSRRCSRPRLVLAARTGGVGRLILNQDEARKVAERVGFEVIVFEPTRATPLSEAYTLINSSHAFIGVHGAALTHHLFLRPGAAFVQVVPIGAEWVAGVCFAGPAREMGLHYMEYRIGVDESSLVEKYGKDHKLVKDPSGSRGHGWDDKVMNIYLKEQNVRLDLVRFRRLLEQVFSKAKRFMDQEG